MRELLARLMRPWTRSLGLQLETLLLISAIWPLLVFMVVYELTLSRGLALLAMALVGAGVIFAGRRAIARLIAPLADLNRQLRITAAGDLSERLPTETVERQHDGLAAFVAQQVDAILIAAVDSQEMIAPVRAARAAGIPVVAVDSGLNDPDATVAVVQTDNYGGGRLAAAELIRLLDGRGEVAIVGLSRHQRHGMEREEGFHDGLAGTPGIRVVAVQHALADPRLAQQITADLLHRHPHLAALYVTDEAAALGVIMALRRQSADARARRLSLICWDMAPLELEALNNGLVDVLIVQNTWALGRRAVEVALDAIAGRPAPPTVQLPTHVITRANLDQLAILRGGETLNLARPPLPRAPAGPSRIGFAIKSPTTDFWSELLAGATSGAQAHGATLILHDSLEGDVNEIGLLRETFNQMIDNIRALVQQLQQEAEIIGPRAQALVSAAAGQTALADEQTVALERLSQGVERLSQTAQLIVTSTQAVSESAAGTLRGVEEAELAVTDSSLRLREIIRRLTEALDLLSQRTGQVTEVADAMRDIADQTHLLSLNAAIEAADAGPYGRRFGVIAEEVRTLAGQALESSEGFLDLAAGMRVAADRALAATQASARGTDLSMELVTQATSAIEGIADLAEHTNSAVQRITAAATEQQQTNGELAGFAERVTATARQAAQASAALSTVAQDLTEVVARLQDSVSFFRITTDEPPAPLPPQPADPQPLPLASAPVEH